MRGKFAVQKQLAEESADLSHRRDQRFDMPDIPPEKDRLATIRKYRPDLVDPRKPTGKTFVLVSGLPRSGTSLMMQMLHAGGLEPKTDGVRQADEDNPKGYYEWEAVKKIATRPQILDEAGLDQKAIKVVSALLEKLPYRHNYRVIFMTRPIEEVVESQAAMIQRLESEGARLGVDDIKKTLANHRANVIRWMKNHPRLEYIEIDYPSLIEKPSGLIPRIIEFLGPERLPTASKMQDVIDQNLYRKRTGSNTVA